MKTSAAARDARLPRAPLRDAVDTAHLGRTLRRIYEGSIDHEPITDAQVDLLLRMRRKERELLRAL